MKQHLALYIGGMGAKDKNFYNDYAQRLGYAEAAKRIQDAFLSGRRDEAAAAVPDQLVDEVALVGSAERIVERLKVWQAAAEQRHVDTIILGTGAKTDALRLIAEARR